MISNSVISEGLAGMQQSQKRMAQAAQDVAKAGLPLDQAGRSSSEAQTAPVSESGTAANDLPANNQIQDAQSLSSAAANYSSSQSGVQDIVEPLIEQRVQQRVFDASANVVQVGNETLGTLIDDLS